jgi:hypothetical protein
MKDMKEETTYGLSPDRLARLLALGLQGSEKEEESPEDQFPGEVLEGMLDRRLSLDPATPDSLAAVLKRPPDEVVAGTQTLGDSLLGSETNLEVIKTLKDYGKELVRSGGSEVRKAAATVIYYGAIASALLFHDRKITQHSYAKLEEAFADLEQKDWIPPELQDLFLRALAACQERK